MWTYTQKTLYKLGDTPFQGQSKLSALALIAGLGLLAFAIILILKPEILAFILAGVFIFLGLGLLSLSFVLKGTASKGFRMHLF
jgi:hypothetical protein